jgi:Uma2 family endonuclease
MANAIVPNTPLNHSPQCSMPYQPMRISVERYHELIARGFFAENANYELLDGVIVEKRTKNRPHSYATQKCYALLFKMVLPSWHVVSQEPITLAQSEPEPDVTVIQGALEDYPAQHPAAGKVALVVEVADSSLSTDRFKAGIYAEAGIPVYWIVNLSERVVEVYTSPKLVEQNWGYSECKLFRGEEEVPVILNEQRVGQMPVHALWV